MTQGQSSKTHRFVSRTLVLPSGEYVDHVWGCRGERVAGACGGTYRCNACDQACGLCVSHVSMPALCIVCRKRFERAPDRE